MFSRLAELKKKAIGILYDISIGVLRDYQRKSLDLAKIEATAYYLQFVKLVRRECLIFILIVFGLILFANVIAVVQMALLLYAPWAPAGKAAAALALGLLSFSAPLFVVLRFFSEKRWMAFTKADELAARAVHSDGR